MPLTKRKQWEYLVINKYRWQSDTGEAFKNVVDWEWLGNNGWGLVSVCNDIYYFKREKLDAKDQAQSVVQG